MDFALVAKRLAGQSPAPDTDARSGEFDRRGFLKLSALGGGGLAVTWSAPAALAAEEGAPAAPKKPVDPSPFIKIHPDNTVEIRVNRLDFGQGALTALPMLVAEELDVDWKQVRASLAPAGEAYKDPLFGIQMTGGSSAVPNSWLQYRQVGAATRMMLVAAAAAQWKVPAEACSTEAGAVRHGSKRATYASLAAAAAKQPVPSSVALKAPADYRIIGHGKGRIDAVASVSGKKRYGIDHRLPGMKVALLQRAPTFGGQVESFDASKAKAIKGVIDVFQVSTDRGGTGLAVIADGYWPARQGREALQVKWKAGVGGTVSSDKLLAQYRDEAKAPKLTALAGDGAAIEAAAKAAPKKISAEYEFPYLAHAPMEPLNATFELKADRATVWAGTQFQTVDQQAIAQTLGLKPEQVTLNTLPAGGGFGRRAVPSSDYLREAAGIAKAWHAKDPKSPLMVMWSREDDIKGGYYRPAHLHRVDVALDAQGQVQGWDHVIVGQSLVKGTPFESFLVKDGIDHTMTEGVVENTYGMPMRLRATHPDVAVPVLWWRSVGHTHTGFVMETLADEVARAAGQDPVAWRLAKLDPKKHARHVAALKLAVEQSGYGKSLPAGHAWGVAVHESFGSVVAYVVDVSLVDGRPKVHAVTAGVHANQVVNPTAAEAQIQGGAVFGLSMIQPGFAITLKDGVVEQSQFSDFAPPRITDAPPVTVHFVPSNDPPTGLGEPGVPPIAPAVANAVAALTGKRLRKLPFEALA
ncbi:xanthine dehydrogenase family protein molybdopterin-binding subunit [Methylibium petroleiphilum]|uniref:xanthine dehydrogenase family protein molybdopterin-binding subunit n=1 Tax=Methylibium petroleiphilum TaxID=105560 RepID=UPI001AC518AF|nr:xanthine dehydrogenase family protein molybdopterin-binding subunit [Methylibium petroleiphilum]MBN9204813.1 xanthine dehydrogenase family protein molybdopterin-binding subunit [Methylibium petroleiphilum]